MKRASLCILVGMLVHSGFAPVHALEASQEIGTESGDARPILPVVSFRSGARVRLKAPTLFKKQMESTVVALDGDTLRIHNPGRKGDLSIPFASITSLEAYCGKRSNTGRGALGGFLCGAAIGIGLLEMMENEGFSTNGAVPQVIMVFGTGGAFLGALMGAITPTERWEPVPLAGLRLGVSPYRQHAVVLAASFRF